MKKRILTLLLCFALLFTFTACDKEGAKGKKESAAVTEIKASPGSLVSLPIELVNNPGMVAAQLSIEYDTSKFEYITSNNGKILTDSGSYQVYNSNGKISAILFSDLSASMKDVKTTGTLFTIKLKVKDDVKPCKEKLKIVNRQFVNINEKEVKPIIKIPDVVIK